MSGVNFDYIVHISDLKFASYNRNEEYSLVFDKLYLELKNLKSQNKSCVIVITGDQFETTDNLCFKFLNALTDIFPTVLTAKLSNSFMMENNNQYYNFCKSGMYELGNMVFLVNMSQKPQNIDKSKKCILIHNILSIKDVSLYDMVLLYGLDRHKKLSSNAWYAGSLIQQNFDDVYYDYGFLLWDTISCEPKFNEVVNDIGYITLIFNDGLCVNPVIKLSKKSVIRCLSANTVDTEITKFINSLTTHVTHHFIIKHGEISKFSSVDIVLSEIEKLNDVDLVSLKELHNKFMKSIMLTNMCHNWYPIQLNFRNMFGYLNDEFHTINFEKGVTSIGGIVGKSSILNLIIFAIYGKLGNNVNLLNVMNINAMRCEVMLKVQYGDTTYRIHRNLSKRCGLSPTEVNNSVALYKFDTKIGIEKQVSMADLNIQKLFGPLSYFYDSNVLNLRNQTMDFFNMLNKDRIDYLKYVFGLGYIDKLKECCINEKNKLGVDEEEKHLLLDKYNKIVSNSDLCLMGINNNLVKISDSMNVILEKSMDIRVRMSCYIANDKSVKKVRKTSEVFVSILSKNTEGRHYSTELLSGYEYLFLRILFKSQLLKYNFMSAGIFLLIDELEVPKELLSLLYENYCMVLVTGNEDLDLCSHIKVVVRDGVIGLLS